MKAVLASLAHLFLLSTLADAGEETMAGVTLLQPMGGRAAALAEAYTTAEDDVLALHYNPAAPLKSPQAVTFYQRGIVEDSFGLLGVGSPTPFGKLAATILFYDAGSINLDNGAGQARTVSAQRDYLLTLSGGWHPLNGLSLGVNAKAMRSTLVDEFTANGYFLDFGVLYKPVPQWAFGTSVQNLGTGLAYGSSSEEVPRTIRVGVSHRFQFPPNQLWLAFDTTKAADDSRPQSHVGLEYLFARALALRAGYQDGLDTGRLTTGLGFRLRALGLDYALIPFGSLGTAQKMTLSYRF